MAALPVRVGDAGEHGREAGTTVAVFGREVRPTEEWLAVWSEEDGERPPARAGQHLDRVHVDRVEVRPLLAIHLDVDELLVHESGDRLVLERLAPHDVAPVASRVTDREEDGPVLPASSSEGLGPPRVPIDRVVGVLAEVRARLPGEAIHVA